MKQKLLALALLSLGIGLSGMAHADLAGGLAAYKAGRYDEGLKLLTEAAQSGDVDAQRELVHIYEFGRHKNSELATMWIARLATHGSGDDLASLADRYQRADGIAYDRVLVHAFNLLAHQRRSEKVNEKRLAAEKEQMSPEQLAEAEAIAAAWRENTPLPATSRTGRRDPRDWYRAAAEKGDLDAAYKVGTLSWKLEYGVEAQPEQAAFWLRKAAQGGIADAQYQLSQLYRMGYGVPKDYVLSFTLLQLAVRGGSDEAQARKDIWDDALTDQQLAEGKALLASWKKGDPLPQASRYGMQRKVNYVEDAEGKLKATPEVEALFKVASEGDEAEFSRLLAKVPNINDYMVEQRKLLHALLQPADSLVAEANGERGANSNPRDIARWQARQARHAALLPAKTRMLALVLQRGANVNEGTLRDHAAALHLAAMFGTPEMVQLLLKHGADPRQYGGQNYTAAPLEFALDQKEYALGLPELITPEQRTANLLALLQAGAARPYILSDEARRRKQRKDKPDRPSADYLLWPSVVSLTRGTAVLDALLKTGTSPSSDGDRKTVFDFAAEAGNAEAIPWLKQRVARYGAEQRDRWLDAAMYAMYSNAPGRDQTLQQLLVKDMNWNQSGPEPDSYGWNYRTLYGGSARIETGTLLNHVTRAHRSEWLPKLAALGMPVDRGGSLQDLLAAVRDNDVESVKALLAQGADPLERPESAFALALEAPAGNDAIVDLMIDHIVTMPKQALAAASTSPVDDLLSARQGVSAARLRKLLDAGASVNQLSGPAIAAAFSAPDRSVATLLIEHGLLDQMDGPRYLFSAMRANRPDLLPVIVAKGANPNQRNVSSNGTVQPNAVEYAIAQNKMEALKVLLAHGGVIDTTSVQPWGTALDRAVASLDPAMLRLVSKDFSLPLKQVCMPSSALLTKVVLDAPSSYWALLREHGFASGCRGLQQRLVLSLAEAPDEMLEGWVGRQLAERLPQLGPRREAFDADTWAAIAASKNDTLIGLLAQAGWKAPGSRVSTAAASTPQKNKAADQALQARLPGHYYLSSVREMGAELLLRPNGKFEYSMAYGAVDQYAQGNWKVWNQQVVFRSESEAPQAAAMAPAADAPKVTAPPGQVLVDLRYQGKSVPGFNVVVLGHAPLKARGRTGKEGWQTEFKGPVRQIAVSHMEVNGGKWLVYTVPAADAQRGSYQLDFTPPAAGQTKFNITLTVQQDNLVLNQQGRDLIFEKH